MRAGPTAAAVAAIALALACGGAEEERRLSAEQPLRIWVSPLLRWEAGGPRRLEFAIENSTNRTVAVAAPDPANARVDVFPGPETTRLCGVAPVTPREPGARVMLAPGDRVAVVVDLGRACGALPPGEYRYEVSYRAAQPEGGKGTAGTLGTRYGQVLVSASPQAVSGEVPPAPPPRRQGRAEPPRRDGSGDRGVRPEGPR